MTETPSGTSASSSAPTSLATSSVVPAAAPARLKKTGSFLFDWQSMSAVDFSRALGRLLKRPVLVVNLADLPYGDSASREPPSLTKSARAALTGSARMERARLLREKRRQWDERGRFLKDLASQAFPDDVTDANWKRWKWATISGQAPAPPEKTAGRIWRRWKWSTISARITTPTNDALRGPGKPYRGEAVALPPRLDGDAWTQAAIIFTPSRSLSAESLWRDVAGLDDPRQRWTDRLERWPKGEAIRHYIFLHELGHVLQRQEMEQGAFVPREVPRARRWLSELDADRFAFAQMEREARRLIRQGGGDRLDAAQELRETVAAIKHTRALQAFLKYPTTYCIAPAFASDMLEASGLGASGLGAGASGALGAGGDPARTMQAYEDCYLAAYELRLRVCARLHGIAMPTDSATLRPLLADWFAGKAALPDKINASLSVSPFNWAAECDVARTIPLLRDIVRKGEIAPGTTTAKLADLVLAAADYLCPSLQSSSPQVPAPGMKSGSTPARPAINGRDAVAFPPPG